MDPTDLFKLLLSPDRLAVVGAVATSSRTVAEAATHAGVDRRVALETIAALLEGGALLEDDGRYRLDPAVLVEAAQHLPQPAPPDRIIFHGMAAHEREVLARFFRGDRLTEIPTARTKRLVVLERLALEFEPGRRYPEPEVNTILGRFHEDHASLRRHLVDEGLLTREPVEPGDGGTRIEYWRSGGRVLTGSPSEE